MLDMPRPMEKLTPLVVLMSRAVLRLATNFLKSAARRTGLGFRASRAIDWIHASSEGGTQFFPRFPVGALRARAAATEALDAVSAALTTENVTEMIRQLRVDLADPAEVAETFLTDQGVLG